MTEAENNDLAGVSNDDDVQDLETGEQAADGQQEEEKKILSLEVKVESPSTCQRHITVVVAREDVDEYIEAEYADLLPKAEVPGFRPGRAPRKLVVSRFKDHVNDQVKGKLLMECLTQITESEDFSPISEPDLNLESIEIPDEGPLTFEFDLEVRPEFESPEWKGLSIEKPTADVTDEDVQTHLNRVLQRFSEITERKGPAEAGDILTLNLEFVLDGEIISKHENVKVGLKPKLSLRDATIENFGELLAGAAKGDVRETEVNLSASAADESLAGKTVQAEFEVVSVEHLAPPALTPQFLEKIGGFEDEDDLRDEVRKELNRQNSYRANQRVREQITSQLTSDADWDLPPALLKRQAQRELRRAVIELQSSGFNQEMIQAYANQLQQNILQYTATSLKEHFILERIAEEEKIDVEEADFSEQIDLIAEQEGIPARRVRARLEKRNEMDSLRNQIVERKVIDLITSHAAVTEVPREATVDDTAAINFAICEKPSAESIPEASHSEEAGEHPK